jgi:hypothetical protein
VLLLLKIHPNHYVTFVLYKFNDPLETKNQSRVTLYLPILLNFL